MPFYKINDDVKLSIHSVKETSLYTHNTVKIMYPRFSSQSFEIFKDTSRGHWDGPIDD